MARPIVHDEALRRRLLEVTAALVARDGFDAVPLREIATAAGTSTSAVYSLFGGKQALFGAVIADGFASLAAHQATAAANGLAALGYAYRDWALEHPELYRLMFDGAALEAFPASESTDDELPSSLGPLYRAVSRRMPHASQTDVLARVIATWAQVHGAVSLELAGVIPDVVPAQSVYASVIAAIDRGFGSAD